MTAVQFLLNGKPCSEDSAPPSMTVLDWLRTRARLTGTKEGCAEGDCGACTIVLGREVDGSLQFQAVNSCLMMLPQIDNRAVFTVEGLAAADGALHPVQQAMIDTDATQCGFCTPGFVMAMFAFHHGGEPAESATMHEALAGNLCRCTGYRSIVEACRRVAQGPADRFVAEAPVLAETLSSVPPCTDYHCGTQTFLMPRSLDALFAAMEQHPKAILLAGGTDLGLRVSKDREALPAVIGLQAVKDLRHVTTGADAIEFGGAVTYSEVLPHLDQSFPSFGALVRRIGSRQIRNLGTIAGNLATASPIGDSIPCLIALGASVRLTSRTGDRVLPGGVLHHRLPQDRTRRGRDHCRRPHSLPCAGPEVLRVQIVQAFRPGHLDRHRRLPPRTRRRQGERIAGGLRRHGGAYDAGGHPRSRRQRPAMGARLAPRCRDAAGARLHPDRGPSRRSLLSSARGVRTLRRFQFETSSNVLVRVDAL